MAGATGGIAASPIIPEDGLLGRSPVSWYDVPATTVPPEATEPSQAGAQLEGVALDGWACKGAAGPRPLLPVYAGIGSTTTWLA